ncbi:hypothetical protein LPTSP1_37450 [Leptospira johnsonii]|uniref:Uncharacterized protein n=2 Tax=Leptospira johnsonii TaxID=1917820 RepID=A0A2P2D7X1_9LEPT|nr:hypothetical protein LPTSP1_37450 [Leptospira johnsonii]
MTRAVKQAVINPEVDYRISRLISLKQDVNGVLIIEADIEKNSKLFKNVCGRIKVPKRINSTNYPWSTNIIFSDCSFFSRGKEIVLKEIGRDVWEKNIYSPLHINIEIPMFVNKKIEYKYYEMQDVEIKDISSHINVQIVYNSNRKSVNNVWYPIALSYDLISGSIHSIGAPFGMVCIYGIGNSKNGFAFFAALPFCGLYKVFSFLDELGGEKSRITDDF